MQTAYDRRLVFRPSGRHAKTMARVLAALATLLVALGTWPPASGDQMAAAAEIHLRGDCRADGVLVLLSDVAEIYSTNPDEVKALGRIDLVPAPAEGQRRYLRLREIEDLLVLRGLNLREHRFSGASKVTIVSVVDAVSSRSDGLPTQPISIRHVSETVQKAIVAYLIEQDPQNESSIVKITLTEDQAQAVSSVKQITVGGGSSPWTGPQTFTIGGPSEKGTVNLTLAAEISLPPMLVVATHSMGRGVIIHPGDVRLQAGQPNQGKARIFQSVEEVIGCETARQVAEGQILDDQTVRPQLLVHRNEIVTIYSRTAGIQVRVTARSREDGAMGDLVTIESLAQRETYFARVVGPQTAEVYAHAIPAHEDSGSQPPNAARLQAAKAAMNQTTLPVSSNASPQAR
ncbi:MAG TPA: flagellar basal body P-ring formation chaperone FlgA [Pirellulales bacterium]|jgi:flagella basal body P-ring formation protein FlgA|nr:flagellar basal body P-ring formation chaperone FlgA [Pirellulales bacterium]